MDLENYITQKRNLILSESFQNAVDSLSSESDRGTVVLGAAWLDESLTKVLEKYLEPRSKSKEDLLKPGMPIGDFGTKIVLAERLGLITKKHVASLKIIRKLRNDFAHIASELSFNTENIKDRVYQLLQENSGLILLMGEQFEGGGLFPQKKPETTLNLNHMIESLGTKHLFICTCGFLNGALSLIEHDIQPSQPIFIAKQQ